MHYEEMSDFEINKEASKRADFGGLIVNLNEDNQTVYLCEKDGLFSTIPISHFDPCNNPSDAWPIIVDNGIGIHKQHNQSWFSSWTTGEFDCVDKNPLRAAMICFLKIKDSQ